MAFQITKQARLKSLEGSKEPQLVFEIDGINTIFGSTSILEFIKVGDVDLYVDGTWRVGGYREILDQKALMSLGSDSGTTTRITQSLDAEKGRGSSVSSMTIGLIDINAEVTRLISPGLDLPDVMGRRCRVYLGFNGTAYKKDFIPIFKGIIDDVQSTPGLVRITIGSPEQRKRQDVFVKSQTKLNGAINNSQTTLTVDETTNYLTRKNKPDGTPETAFSTYVRIDDEIIQYSGVTLTTFTGCTRGALGTTAAAHDDNATVDSFYRLEGNGIDLALKLMLSGWEGYFQTGYAAKSIVYVDPTLSVANSIFFEGVNVKEELGLSVGDWVTVSGSVGALNDFSMQQISSIEVLDLGSYIVISGVTLSSQPLETALCSFRSQYDSLGIGAGGKMIPDDVDVEQHKYLRNLFFNTYSMDAYITDTINIKDFCEEELYLPGGMFSCPRKARSSVQAHSGPVPSSNIKTLDDTSVTNPTKLNLRRSLGKAFYNSIVTQYDQEPLDLKFLTGKVDVANDSLTRIPVGNRILQIKSRGLRSSLSAQNIITASNNRRLKRYKFAAEIIENIDVAYGVGYTIEIGDIVILDGSNLAISDTLTGERGKQAKFFEVMNKTLDVKSGKITLSIIDTAYDVQSRYSLIGPSSKIKSGTSTSEFIIESDGFYSNFDAEQDKWTRFKRPRVRVRNSSFTVNESTVVSQVIGSTIIVSPALTFTPSAGMIMEMDVYNNTTEEMKLLFGFMRDTGPFDDGKSLFLML